MIKTIRRKARDWRRRRRLNLIRREFARSGYPVEHLNDARLEKALTGGGSSGSRRIENVPLTAKTIYFALRRLSTDDADAGAKIGILQDEEPGGRRQQRQRA
jgi:hypothetical protein